MSLFDLLSLTDCAVKVVVRDITGYPDSTEVATGYADEVLDQMEITEDKRLYYTVDLITIKSNQEVEYWDLLLIYIKRS